jgi:hypothetical protein
MAWYHEPWKLKVIHTTALVDDIHCRIWHLMTVIMSTPDDEDTESLKMLDTNSLLAWLITWADIIAYSCYQSFRSYLQLLCVCVCVWLFFLFMKSPVFWDIMLCSPVKVN